MFALAPSTAALQWRVPRGSISATRAPASRTRSAATTVARRASASLADASDRSPTSTAQPPDAARLGTDLTRAADEYPTASSTSRRQALLALAASASAICGCGDSILLHPPPAAAADSDAPSALQRGLSRYIKKKKLDPLESFVPSVLLTKAQLIIVQAVVDDEASTLEDLDKVRTLLRAGPAGTLRTDLRALTRYAAEGAAAGLAYTPGGDGYFPGSPEAGAAASAAADRCLDALGGLDTLLRLNPADGRPRMAKQARVAISALDEVLATVPDAIRVKSEAIVAKYLTPATENAEESAGSGSSEGGSEGSAEDGGAEGAESGQGQGAEKEKNVGGVRRLGQKKTQEEVLESLL